MTDRTGREGWTEEERELWDAQADHEAWSHAAEILHPLAHAVRPIGSDELTQVMEKALAEVDGEVKRTHDVLESLEENKASEAAIEPSYREVLEELAISRGFEGAEEVAMRAVELDPRHTVQELLEAPNGGYGTALDAVLHMSEEEKRRITDAFTRTFIMR